MTEPVFLDVLMNAPLHVPKMGMRPHAIMAGIAGPAAAQAIVDGNHTCHLCGVHLPNGMEIDNLDGDHSNFSVDNLKPICPVCHYSRHPTWAAQHNRLRLIWMPQARQIDINRLYWAVQLLSDDAAAEDGFMGRGLFEVLQKNEDLLRQAVKAIPGLADDDKPIEGIWLAINSVMNDLVDDVDAREQYCSKIIGSSNAESFVEGFYQVRDAISPEQFGQTLAFLKSGLRYWPQASGVSWKLGRAKDMSNAVVASAYADDGPLNKAAMTKLIVSMGAPAPEAVSVVSTA